MVAITHHIFEIFTSVDEFLTAYTGLGIATPTEADVRVPYMKGDVTVSNLAINCIANPRTGASSYIIRKDGVNTTLDITIAGSTTGFFSDTDSVSDTGEHDWTAFCDVGSGSGNIDFAEASVLIENDVDSNAVQVIGGNITQSTSSDRFFPLTGQGFGTTTEADAQSRLNIAGNFNEMVAEIRTNSSNTAETIELHKGGVNQISISIVALTTGEVQATDTAACADGEDWNWLLTGIAGGGEVIDAIAYTRLETTNGKTQVFTQDSSGDRAITAGNSDAYFNMMDLNITSNTDPPRQTQIKQDEDYSNLEIEVITNSLIKALFERPNSDETLGTWEDDGGGTTDIFNAIDANSSADFIITANDPSADTARFGLSNIADPGVSTGHVIRIRADKDNNKTTELKWALMQGSSTVIHEETITDLPKTTPTTTEYTLSAGETDNITDYSDLQFRVIATVSGGGPATSAKVYWFELQIPETGEVSHIAFRKNATTGNLDISLTEGQTGFFEDTGLDSIVTDDKINYLIETTDAVSGTIVIKQFSIIVEPVGVAPALPVEAMQAVIIG